MGGDVHDKDDDEDGLHSLASRHRRREPLSLFLLVEAAWLRPTGHGEEK